MLQHPGIASTLSHGQVYALNLVAFLTCGPDAWPRICRQARKMLFRNGFVRLLQALWGVDPTPVITRNREGMDTCNMQLQYYTVTGKYQVLKTEVGTKKTTTVCSATHFDAAIAHLLSAEQPIHEWHYSRAHRWSVRRPFLLAFTPIDGFQLHGCVPTAERLLKSECYQRSVSDPLYEYYIGPNLTGRDRRYAEAHSVTWSGTPGTPFFDYITSTRRNGKRQNGDPMMHDSD